MMLRRPSLRCGPVRSTADRVGARPSVRRVLLRAGLLCAAAAAFGIASAATAAADNRPVRPANNGLLGTVAGVVGSTVTTLTDPITKPATEPAPERDRTPAVHGSARPAATVSGQIPTDRPERSGRPEHRAGAVQQRSATGADLKPVTDAASDPVLGVVGTVVRAATAAVVAAPSAPAGPRSAPTETTSAVAAKTLATDSVTRLVAPVTATVAQAVSPVVSPAVEPIAELAEPVTAAVVAPLARAVEPAVQILAPVIRPVTTALAPVLDPVLVPVVGVVPPVARIVAPVTGPALRPVADVVAPVTGPIGGEVIDPVVRPTEPASPGDKPRPPTSWLPGDANVTPAATIPTPVHPTTPTANAATGPAAWTAGWFASRTATNAAAALGVGGGLCAGRPLTGWAAWVAHEQHFGGPLVLDWGSGSGAPWSPDRPLPTAPSCTVAGCGASAERPQLQELPAGLLAGTDPIHYGTGAQLAPGYSAGLSARAALVKTRPG